MIELSFTLNNPLTEEDWNKISDAEFEHTNSITFKTPKGKAVTFVKQLEWIPIKTRPMTDEERDYWSARYGYDVEYEDAVMFDCEMPKDKQEIWVQSKNGFIFEDVCENDDGMIGLEEYGDWVDIVAWMPKPNRPKLYKPKGGGRNE